MTNKGILISSLEEAEQFLKAEIAERDVPHFVFQNEPSSEHNVVLKAFVPEGAKEIPIFQLYMGHKSSDSLCFLDAVGVHGQFKNSGLGGCIMKAVLGIVHGQSAQFLLLRDITSDGASFWSYYGAVPAKEPKEFAAKIQKLLQDPTIGLSPNDRLFFEEAQKIGTLNPFHGWRALSQADELSGAGKAARHKLFDSFCQRDVGGLIIREAMVIFPAEESTYKVLERRLGKIPNFRRVKEMHPLEELLSQAPTIPTKGTAQPCNIAIQQHG